MAGKELDELKCGNCGGEVFRLFSEQAKGEVRFGGGPTFSGKVMVRCEKCGSKSKIGPAPAAIEVDSEGTLCGGWGG